MKSFVPHRGSNVDGALLSDGEAPRPAIFLTPGQAKFMATFRGVREGKIA